MTGAAPKAAVRVTYFSDLLCVWAYVSQARIAQANAQFGDDIAIESRFCSVFPDTARKIPAQWKERGGYDGFNRHLREIAERFPHVEVHPNLWLTVRPASSASPQLFVKAVEIAEAAGDARGAAAADEISWALRLAFFRDGRDIALWAVQCAVAEAHGIALGPVEDTIRSGQAYARLAADYAEAERLRVEGSPTYLLNEVRQRLYGNIGYRVLQANIEELLRTPMAGEASWC